MHFNIDKMANIIDSEVTVTGITPSVDLESGEEVYQINFTKKVQITEKTTELLKKSNQVLPLTGHINVIQVLTYIPTKKIPYQIGSRWKLRIKEDGEISISQIK